MIEPYNAVGLIPTFWGIRRRADIKKNLEHLHSLTKAAFWLSNLDIPVRLLAIPEGALMGFNDEVLDVDHAEYARTCCIDIPGPETDDIGKLARQWKVFIMAQAKARHKDWKDRFFNIGFIVDPDGKIILQHYKLSALLPVERSVSPHDVYDWWIEKHGRTLDAFWPVADTEIGRLGIMMAMEGNYPENGRGLAMNGAEVVYRASMPAPFTENDIFEISNRARALENNMYIVAPNIGSYHLYPDSEIGIDAGGGQSMIVDYRGQLVGKQRDTNGSTFVAGGDQLDEGCPRRARPDHLRAADLSEEPLHEEAAAEARPLQARRDREAGRADAEARNLEEAVEALSVSPPRACSRASRRPRRPADGAAAPCPAPRWRGGLRARARTRSSCRSPNRAAGRP